MLQPFVLLIFYSWILVPIFLFSQFPPRKALLISVISSALFLTYVPFTGPAGLQISKITVTSIGCLLGTILFHSERITTFVPGLLDLPFLVLTFWVIPSQLANGLSPLSPVANHILNWGVPYFLGRIYLNDLNGLKQLSIGIFVGGLAYAPLCLWESRMSPNLHVKIYGVLAPVDWGQGIRLGGYRPSVFLGHGLPVGMWMAAATLVGLWFWQFKVFKKFWNQPIQLLAIGLLVTFILVRSTGAYIYAISGLGILIAVLKFRTALPLLALIMMISGYVGMAATGDLYNTPHFKRSIELSYAGEALGEREGSYWYRVRNDKLMSAHTRNRLLTGWGGSGGNLVIDPRTGRQTVTDSLWIIMYGVFGAPGLIGFTAMFMLPSVVFVLRYPARLWTHPKIAPVSVLPIVSVMYMWDCTLNGFPNPVFILIPGALVGMLEGPRESLAIKQPKSKQLASTNYLTLEMDAKRRRVLAAKRACGTR